MRWQIARNAPSPSAVTVVVEFEPSNDVRAGPRPYSFTWEALPLQSPPAIECFRRPGRKLYVQPRIGSQSSTQRLSAPSHQGLSSPNQRGPTIDKGVEYCSEHT